MFVRLSKLSSFIPLRYSFAQARKIPNIWNCEAEHYNQMANALLGAYSTQQFGVLLSENINEITDQQLAYAMSRISLLNLDADKHFYDLLVPVIKDFVSNFTRDHAQSLSYIVACCGQLNVKDAELWQLFEKKLIEERLYRYVPLKELVMMTHDVALSDNGSQAFFNTMENQIGRHKLALTSEDIELCTEAFEKKKLVGPIIKQLRESQKKQLA